MLSLLFKDIAWKKRARLLAMLWTLLIFFLCFLPGKEIPEINVPFVDKWAHFVVFFIWSFLWMASFEQVQLRNFILVLIAAGILGWLTEYVQGQFTSLGRHQDRGDILADIAGGVMGLLTFFLLYCWQKMTSKTGQG